MDKNIKKKQINDFWTPKTLEEIMAEQGGPKMVHNLSDLVADFWPEDESIEDFLEFLRESREEELKMPPWYWEIDNQTD